MSLNLDMVLSLDPDMKLKLEQEIFGIIVMAELEGYKTKSGVSKHIINSLPTAYIVMYNDKKDRKIEVSITYNNLSKIKSIIVTKNDDPSRMYNNVERESFLRDEIEEAGRTILTML